MSDDGQGGWVVKRTVNGEQEYLSKSGSWGTIGTADWFAAEADAVDRAVRVRDGEPVHVTWATWYASD